MNKKLLVPFLILLGVGLASAIFCFGFGILSIITKSNLPTEPEMKGNFPLKEKWRFQSIQDINTTPTAHNGLVLFPSSSNVYALEAETGHILWERDLEEYISNPIEVFDNFVVVGGTSIYVLDLKNGTVLWKATNSHWGNAHPVAYINNILLVQYAQFELFAYNINTGNILWQENFSREEVEAYPEKDFIYIHSESALIKYDINTGKLINRIELDGYSDTSDYKSGIFYFDEITGDLPNNEELHIVAFDSFTNKVIWKRSIDKETVSSPNTILATDNGLFIGNRSSLLLLDLSGNKIWENTINGSQTPVVIDENVYYRGVFNENIYAVSLENGKETGHLAFNTSSHLAQPSVEYDLGIVSDEDSIFFCVNNMLYAYEK